MTSLQRTKTLLGRAREQTRARKRQRAADGVERCAPYEAKFDHSFQKRHPYPIIPTGCMVFGGGVPHCARLRLLPGSPGTVEGTVRGRVDDEW